MHPEQFWYTSGAEIKLPFNILGLVAFELFAMHWVEVKRGLDLKDPGSQDFDPVFQGNKLKPHDVSEVSLARMWACRLACMGYHRWRTVGQDCDPEFQAHTLKG